MQRLLEKWMLLVWIEMPIRTCRDQMGGFGCALRFGSSLLRKHTCQLQAHEASQLRLDIYSSVFYYFQNDIYQIILLFSQSTMTTILKEDLSIFQFFYGSYPLKGFDKQFFWNTNQVCKKNIAFISMISGHWSKYANMENIRSVQSPRILIPALTKLNIGLTNEGLTCYINSALQCLLNRKQFAQYFIEADKYYTQHDLNRQMIDVAKAMWTPRYRQQVYKMKYFYRSLTQTIHLYSVNKYRQMDSQQFIQNLLNYLKDNPINPNSAQKLKSLFQGEFSTTIKCKRLKFYSNFECGALSVNLKEPFYSIPLTIISQKKIQQIQQNQEDRYYFFKLPFRWGKKQTPPIQLTNCLANFSQKTILDNENKWYCKKCQQDTVSQRQMKVYSTGKVVMIHLLRFVGQQKYTQKIDYPEFLEQSLLLQNGKKQSIYQLTGIICHIGRSLKGGHYYSCCLNQNEEKWYRYSDQSVRRAYKEQCLSNQDAYVLFYYKLS